MDPKQSETDRLVTEIELMTGSSWTQDQRISVGDRIRQYRFDQLAMAAEKVQKIVKESGDTDLSNKIFIALKK